MKATIFGFSESLSSNAVTSLYGICNEGEERGSRRIMNEDRTSVCCMYIRVQAMSVLLGHLNSATQEAPEACLCQPFTILHLSYYRAHRNLRQIILDFEVLQVLWVTQILEQPERTCATELHHGIFLQTVRKSSLSSPQVVALFLPPMNHRQVTCSTKA